MTLSQDEQDRLSGAVRESVRRRTLAVINGVEAPDVLSCPSCGERTILLDKPETFVIRDHARMCSACGAERDLVQLYRSEADLGGEGGG